MISSILLIVLNLMGKINADESMGFFKWYFLGVAIEVVIYVLSVPKILDKLDKWRNKNEQKNKTAALGRRVLQLQKDKGDLTDRAAELKARIEKQNADILTLKSLTERQRLQIEALEGQTPWKDIKNKSEVIGRLVQAKELIKNIVRVTWGEGWNYSFDWKVKAEQFLNGDGCPDCFCEDCTKEDCGIKNLD